MTFQKMSSRITITHKFDFIFILLITCLFGYFIPLLITQDSLSLIGPTSATALGQLLFWSTNLFLFLILGGLFLINKVNLLIAARFALVTIIATISGVMTGSSLYSLSGTPLYFGHIRADLGTHMSFSASAMENYIPDSGYPPLWPMITGNLTRILGLEILDTYKMITILGAPVLLIISLKILQKTFQPILAELILLFFVLSFLAPYGWKHVGNFLTQILLLLIIKRAIEVDASKNQRTFKFKLVNIFFGIIFGLSVSLYYGELWWISGSVSFSLILLAFTKRPHFNCKLTIIDFLIGAAVPLMPVFFGLRQGYSVVNTFLFASFFCIFWAFLKLPKKIESIIGTFGTLVAGMGILYFLKDFRVGDNYIYDGVLGNPVVDIGISDFKSITLYLLFLIPAAVISLKYVDYQAKLFFLTANLFCSILMMYYFAFKMDQSGYVELWPRASGSISQSLLIISVISLFLIAQNFLEKKIQFNSDFNKIGILIIPLLSLVALLFYFSYQLGNYQWGLMPHNGNEAHYSYIDIPEN